MKLTFSAEAKQIAAEGLGLREPASLQRLDHFLDAILAHDAERLAREIIAQRVAALSLEEVREFSRGADLWSHPNDWRAALLRVLTEEPHEQ